MLSDISPQDSTRPNELYPRVLKEMAKVLEKLLSITFEISESLGKVPPTERKVNDKKRAHIEKKKSEK